MHQRLRTETNADWAGFPTSPSADAAWLLVEEGFNVSREREIESLFTVSNGYVGTRGALAEGNRFSSPATFIAGVFALDEEAGSMPELVVAPDWTQLRLSVNGEELGLRDGQPLEHLRILDMQQGIHWRFWRHRDSTGRITRLRFMRLASLADRHLLIQSLILTPENYTSPITIEALVGAPPTQDGLVSLVAVRPMSAFMPDPAGGGQPRPLLAEMELRTRGTGITIAMAAGSRLQSEWSEHIGTEVIGDEGRIVERAVLEAKPGATYRLDRCVCVHTSRETSLPSEIAVSHLEEVLSKGLNSAIREHVMAWKSRWQDADVDVQGDDEARRALRFASFHLIAASNPDDERVSVGARALTGRAYKGHVFWDTEIYMLPFFTFTHPAAARAMLMYRYNTLPGAREKARSLGYRGALFAWESADTGQETTPPFAVTPNGQFTPVLSGKLEHHISADIAYAVWRYWQATADDRFFLDAGANIMLETARFWASRGHIEDDGRYHIKQVIGPDEYHEGVDDNAYTNVMAQFNLEEAANVAQMLQERWPERWQEIASRLKIRPEEPDEWRSLAEVMYTGFNPETGLFEQFQGYFELEEIDLASYEHRTAPMDVILGPERITCTKVIKQADVVMLIYLLWDRFTPRVREANFRYYEPRTGHGSSLSPSIHALVAARLGDQVMAERYFRQAAEIDLADNMGNAASGVHAAALGGLWQASVFGLAGLLREDGLEFHPHLPAGWRELSLRVQWRGRRLSVAIRQPPEAVDVRLRGDERRHS